MIRNWLRSWLGIDRVEEETDLLNSDTRFLHSRLDGIEAEIGNRSLGMRLQALENSMRKVERDVKIIAPDYEASVEMEARKAAAVRERYEISAAQARGMSLEAYRTDLAARRAARAALTEPLTFESEHKGG